MGSTGDRVFDAVTAENGDGLDETIVSRDPPKSGLVPLTAVDCEAVKGLSAAQRELNARWRTIELEILEDAPQNARVTNWDLEQGVAKWEVKP